MICLNPLKHQVLLYGLIVVVILVMSLMNVLAYIGFTMNYNGLGYMLIFILLALFMWSTITVLLSFPVRFIIRQANRPKLYLSNNEVLFQAGSYKRILPKQSVSAIVMHQGLLSVYTTTGDIFAQVAYNHYKHVKRITKKFGYQYLTHDPGNYILVEHTNLSHELKSEIYFRSEVANNGAYMNGLELDKSNRYLMKQGIFFMQSTEGPKVKFANNVLFNKDEEYLAFQRGQFSLFNLKLFVVAVILFIGFECLYYLIWDRISDKPHINQTAVTLGYIIYPALNFISFACIYKFQYPVKRFCITSEAINLQHKRKQYHLKKQDIIHIMIDRNTLKIQDKYKGIIVVPFPDEYGLFYDLQKYDYPFEVYSEIQDKIKWYPGIKAVSPQVNGLAKSYYYVVQDDETSGYNKAFVASIKKRIEDNGLKIIKPKENYEALYIDQGGSNGRDLYL